VNVRDKERTERVAADSLSIVGETSAHGTTITSSVPPRAATHTASTSATGPLSDLARLRRRVKTGPPAPVEITMLTGGRVASLREYVVSGDETQETPCIPGRAVHRRHPGSPGSLAVPIVM
jgi:hypothetical protein